MLGVFFRMIKDKWKSALVYTGSSIAFAEMYVAVYPTMKDAIGEMEKFMDAFPKEFMEAFGFKAETLTFSTVESLLSTELFTFFWPIILIILAISLASYAIVNDIEKGTIEVVLAQPVSRIKIFFARYIGGLSILLMFVFASIYGIIPLCIMHNIEYNPSSYWSLAVLNIFFAWAVFSVATFFSSMFSEKGKATFASTGLLLIMYAGNIVSGLYDKIENLKYVSFFHYLDASGAMLHQSYVEGTFWVFSTVALVTTIAAAIIFNSRDITT